MAGEALLRTNQEVFVKLFATKQTAFPTMAAADRIDRLGFGGWVTNQTGRTRERGGNSPTVLRQAVGVTDLATLSFSVDYTDTAGPNGEDATNAKFNYGYCQNYFCYIEEREDGSGSGKPSVKFTTIVQTCPKVDSGGAWALNVTVTGDGVADVGTQ